MDEKESLRNRMKQKLGSQSYSERRKRSRVIQKRLLADKLFLNAKCIMLYISKGTREVETSSLIRNAFRTGKKVLLPVTFVGGGRIEPVLIEDIRDSLRIGPYGIFEPQVSDSKRIVKIDDIDLVIVPGLAFDKNNNRLGRGRGYYDRFLKRLHKDIPKIGIGFRFQRLSKIPTAKKDFPLTKVITN